MSYKVSLIITSFLRPHLLKWGLLSLARQSIPFEFETIVINDGIKDNTEQLCSLYQKKLNIKYIFSGHRNLSGGIKWRVPGFAVNIAAKQSSAKVLIISCAEMFHFNETVKLLTLPVLENSKLISIPRAWDDEGSFLEYLNKHNRYNREEIYNQEILNNYGPLNVYLPFLLGVSREEFYGIGGYDEDFTGMAFDDNDLVERLQLAGCTYRQTEAKAMHLYHRHVHAADDIDRCLYNGAIYRNKQGKILRNEHREWGKLYKGNDDL